MRWKTLFALSFILAFWSAMSPSSAASPRRALLAQIGILGAGKQEYSVAAMNALRSGLTDLGWNERRVHLIERWTNGQDERLRAFAAELVELNVDVIIAVDSESVRAAMRATRRIPIVFPLAWDPVAENLVASLGRPGGNVTGLSAMAPDLYAKELILLKEAIPSLRKLGVVTDSAKLDSREMVKALLTTGGELGVELTFVDIRPLAGLEGRLYQMTAAGVEALTGFVNHPAAREQCIRFAVANRIPLVGYTDNPPGLLSLEIDELAMIRRSASYVDKILRGTQPSELPVEQPRQFHFIVNLKTASALGLAIPESVLLQADEVIR
jgi:putative ABC transport system substrate-binding protein